MSGDLFNDLAALFDRTSFAWNNLLGRIAPAPLTLPKQPAFLAYNSVTDTNVTGNGTIATVNFDTEVFDQGNNFAANTFTAPVTGKYRFSTNVRILELTNAADVVISLVTSNRTIHLFWWSAGTIGGGGILITGGSALVDMDAGDTAFITAYVNGIGADTADVFGHATFLSTSFSGELVC